MARARRNGSAWSGVDPAAAALLRQFLTDWRAASGAGASHIVAYALDRLGLAHGRLPRKRPGGEPFRATVTENGQETAYTFDADTDRLRFRVFDVLGDVAERGDADFDVLCAAVATLYERTQEAIAWQTRTVYRSVSGAFAEKLHEVGAAYSPPVMESWTTSLDWALRYASGQLSLRDGVSPTVLQTKIKKADVFVSGREGEDVAGFRMAGGGLLDDEELVVLGGPTVVAAVEPGDVTRVMLEPV